MLTLLWTILGLWVAWKCFRSVYLDYRAEQKRLEQIDLMLRRCDEQQKRDNEHRWQQVDLDRALREKRQHDNEQLWQQVDEAVNQDGAP